MLTEDPALERHRRGARREPRVMAVPASEVRDKMRGARCLVMPSVWYEACPMTILEAFSNGVPVIASDLGAMHEIITPGTEGQLFPPGDPDGLAQVVRTAFAEPDALRSMGLAARQAYERRFSPQANLGMMETIYADAIAEAKIPLAL